MDKTTHLKQITSQQTLGNNGASLSLDVPVLKSELIFQGQQQRVIDHGGEQYTLRITKQGKLILTK